MTPLCFACPFAGVLDIPGDITPTGYTPLHLAAMNRHEAVIEMLVQVYRADSNIRDYSGKKAKQYLSNTMSSHTQRKSLSIPITDLDLHLKVIDLPSPLSPSQRSLDQLTSAPDD
ncbi:hypothetical protein LSAT2_023523 [Lamellibrachia satsuma]|nr:hypothetical protein LSAT2_023523 [Lamellibrachia satsuma]